MDFDVLEHHWPQNLAVIIRKLVDEGKVNEKWLISKLQQLNLTESCL